jgi:hypothetical protein
MLRRIALLGCKIHIDLSILWHMESGKICLHHSGVYELQHRVIRTFPATPAPVNPENSACPLSGQGPNQACSAVIGRIWSRFLLRLLIAARGFDSFQLLPPRPASKP